MSSLVTPTWDEDYDPTDITKIVLNAEQQNLVHELNQFLSSGRQIFRADGAAGTGKSTTVAIWAAAAVKAGYELALAAPTNKATRNLRSFSRKISRTAQIRVATIFSLLGLIMDKSGEARELRSTESDRLRGVDILVVDEWSMINDSLMNHLLRYLALNPALKVIFMGDPYQIPPVGQEESSVCQYECDARLTKVERHDNQILTLATYLRECIDSGTTPTMKSDYDEAGGVFVLRSADWYKQMRKAFSSQGYIENGDAFKAIAWRNAIVDDHNETIREAMYGDKPGIPFEIGERVVAKGPVLDMEVFIQDGMENFSMTTDEEARVLAILVRNHPVFTDIEVYDVRLELEDGETATAYLPTRAGRREYQRMDLALSNAAKKEKRKWADFWQFKGCFADVVPCHALTGHRSQGSTYRTVFLDAADIMSNRTKLEMLRLLYTGATRPSKSLIIKV